MRQRSARLTTKNLRLWPNIILGCATICVLLVLAADAYTGSLARYFADDYCTSSVFREKGLWRAQQYWYFTWSGRYAFYFFVDLAELGGTKLIAAFPSIIIVTWLSVLTWTLLQWLTSSIRLVRRELVALFLAGIVLLTTLEGTPNICQSLFWRTGALTYIAPLIFLIGFLGLIGFHKTHTTRIKWPALALSFVVTFTASGFSETYAAVQTTFLTLLAILLLTNILSTSGRKLTLYLVLSGLLGAVLGMAAVIVAPGNAIRQSFFSPTADLYGICVVGLLQVKLFLEKAVLGSREIVLLTVAFPFFLSLWIAEAPEKPWCTIKWLLLTIVLSPVLLLSCFVPALYGMGAAPPGRALIVPQFVLVCSLVGIGWLLGSLMKRIPIVNKRSATTVLSAVFLVGVLWLVWFSANTLIPKRLTRAAQARPIAAAWDQRDLQIRQAKSEGVVDLVVTPWRCPCGLADIGPDANHWVNNCAARHYGLNTIRTEQP